jgi:polysaccharide deacetylase family protein (PEP-CTERM system associated)
MNQTDQTDQKYFLLTFDVEDWFQVENLKSCIPYSSWGSCELRVEKNVHKILDLLDSVFTIHDSRLTPQAKDKAQNVSRHKARESPKATFFVLGWIAERLPHLVLEIYSRGHEIASHGYNHCLCHLCSEQDLKDDLIKSKKLLEDLVGVPIRGYRAPSFSVNFNLLNLLEEYGYQYDSSYNSFGGNSRYGKISLKQNGDKEAASAITENFYELPISNLTFGSRVFPLGGGGYFRLIPFPFFSKGIRAILKKQKAYVFYLHPWELDPGQPRVNKASRLSRFRHYYNLEKTEMRLMSLIKRFKDCHFVTAGQYLKEITTSSI